MKCVARPCPVCLHTTADLLHSQRFGVPDGYPLPDHFDIVSCVSCGLVYADTSASQDAYNRHYASQSSYQSQAGAGCATPVWDL